MWPAFASAKRPCAPFVAPQVASDGAAASAKARLLARKGNSTGGETPEEFAAGMRERREEVTSGGNRRWNSHSKSRLGVISASRSSLISPVGLPPASNSSFDAFISQ